MKLRNLLNDPTALTALTVGLWSTGAVMGKLLSERSGYSSLLLSLAVASAGIAIFRYFFIPRPFPRKLLALRPVLAGIAGYALYWIFYFKSFRLSPSPSMPVLFNYTWPIFTVIFSHLLQRGAKSSAAVRCVELGGMLLGLAGIWLAVSSGDESFTPGLAAVCGWGLAAGAAYGIFSAYSAGIPREDQLDFLLLAIISSSFFLLPASYGELGAIKLLTWSDIALIGFFGLFSEALGSLCWVQANSRARELGINISRAASLIYTLPLLSLILISIVFGETLLLRPGFIAGCLLVTACIAVCSRAAEIAGRLGRRSGS